MLEFNDLLVKSGIDPKATLVMRHRPWENELRRTFSWIAAERPKLFNAYQSTQTPNVEKALKRATFVASFIGMEAGKATFIGMYRNNGVSHRLTRESYRKDAVLAELLDLGMHGFADDDPRDEIDYFDLSPEDVAGIYQARLVVSWNVERSWFRWADRNSFPIQAILPVSFIEQSMPDWDDLVLTRAELATLPAGWATRMAEWRGIYLISDISDGKRYVGAAYGDRNILGRWQEYGRSGHGENVRLRRRDPENFRFSILQRVSPDMDAEEVIQLESSWKKRLLSREIGLNAN